MDGVINVNKPSGITSFDVIRHIKKVTGIKKIGHTGTLDPLATGVLPICIGKATKAVEYIMNDYKIYKAQLKLGVTTDTYDREGTILETSEVDVSKEAIINCINSFVGEISQVPPIYSAIKVKGKRLYELAREGIEVEISSRTISIYEINILNIENPYVTFIVKCSKGTYIRSLCYDIGKKLKCGATMWNLERTQSGNISIDNSINLNEIDNNNIEKHLLPVDKVLDAYEKRVIDNKLKKLLLNGVCVGDKRLLNNFVENVMYRIYDEDMKFLGLVKMNNKGLKLEKIFI